MPDGKDYCERKIKFLKENHQKLVEVSIIVIFMIGKFDQWGYTIQKPYQSSCVNITTFGFLTIACRCLEVFMVFISSKKTLV